MKIPVDINVKKRCITEEDRLKACDIADGEAFTYDINGTMTIGKGFIKLNYEENDGISVEETLYGKNRRIVAVKKENAMLFTLFYEVGTRCSCFFSNDDKDGYVRVETNSLEVDLSEMGGCIHTDYVSEIVGAGVERVDLTLSITPSGKFLKS